MKNPAGNKICKGSKEAKNVNVGSLPVIFSNKSIGGYLHNDN